MNNDLSKLVEAVRAAHADIAPTYAEYVQLAFAIATDCGEAGRSDFISLCEPSPKFNALHANKLFSSALRTGNQNVHLGTAFHLAKLAGVEIGFKFQGFTTPFSSHTHKYIIIQFLMIAPSASGKNIMSWLRKFFEAIHPA